jgi:hypothetical protein
MAKKRINKILANAMALGKKLGTKEKLIQAKITLMMKK